ncbi:MAG: SDR family NAD(P)-dependent oxidoreductase [Ruminiclostridium sp.]|nr:SDR family NAD(P)-dependent oxidoreductase [Ruminiclostridium sp.]MBQ9932946.1 SDR family NAD(P)-dependent oxidoreductase [Ruminiclostridium sp.]
MIRKMEGFAVVTGSSRGLGAYMIRQLASEGYDVVINHVSDSSKEKAAALAAEVTEKHGVKAVVVQGDVSSYENCEKLVVAGEEAFGTKLAVFVSNAGIHNMKLFQDLKQSEYEHVLNVELFGALHCAHVAIPRMQKAKEGCLVFITSIAGLYGQVTEADYSAAKAGMHGLMRALARENAELNVRVNCIAPGNIETEIFDIVPEEILKPLIESIPMKRLGQPEDVSECLSYIINAPYLTGQIISPNGGMAMY